MEKEKVMLPKFNVETYLKDGDAVVAKVEVFQVYTMFSLSDCLEHIIKLFLTVHQ